MKANKRITKTIITIFIIILLGTTVFAENTIIKEEQNTSVSTNTATTSEQTKIPQTVTNTQNKTVNQTTTRTTTIKSSNANLSNLGITPHDFSGFKENKTDYNVTVPNTITEVEVYATKKDSKASIEGTGKVKLQEGENVAKVIVTAEDGTTKTYTINIKRLKSGEKETVSIPSSGAGLSKLEIKGVSLEPSFNEEVYQYKVNFEGDEQSLDIIAKASKANSNVKIIGNENLINGQNIITIIVTDSKETSVTTYQIYANKNMMEQEELNKQFEEAQKQYEIKQWIIIILVVVIVICIIILLILIYKKTNNEEYQYQKSQRKSKKEKLKNENKSKKENSRKGKSGKHSM